MATPIGYTTSMTLKPLTVRDVLERLDGLDPDLEVWTLNHYGTGVRPYNPKPEIVTIALVPSGSNPPRLERELRFLTDKTQAKFTERRQVVYL